MPVSPYVIINDTDAPEPRMVCQRVPGVGYCYLDRSRGKPDFDGMQGAEATPVEAFGFVWADNSDGAVTFYRVDRPITATYRDGEPRCWQHAADSFEFRKLNPIAEQSPLGLPRDWTPGISDTELVRRAVQQCRSRHLAGFPHPRGVAVAETFLLGSTYAARLCRRFGFDPDEMVSR